MTKFWLPLATTACLAFSTAILAQTEPHSVCGTHDVDIEVTKANILAAAAFAKTHPTGEKGAIRYFPVRFKVIGNADGVGEAQVFDLLGLLESMNRDFAVYNWRFFLEDVQGTPFDYFFNDVFNSELFQNPNFLTRNRSSNAITIYTTANASTSNPGEGITLGYYNSQQDILVLRTTQVNTNAFTANHELGHYFSLPHTFRGWDFVSWDGAICSDTTYNSPVTETQAPNRIRNQDIAVELVTRGDGANCATSGDLFCDTPADYNLGLGYPSCRYDGRVKDRNGDALAPAEDNYMGYFTQCNTYEFSPQQFATMSADALSTRRFFLAADAAPINLDSVRIRPEIVSPVNGQTTAFSDEVTITWTPVPGALYYYLEVSTDRSLTDRTALLQTIVPAAQASYTLKNLQANKRHFVRLRGFNQLTVGLPSQEFNFRTGTVSGTRAAEAVRAFVVYPNPVASGAGLVAAFSTSTAGDFDMSVVDVTGRQLSTVRLSLGVGENRVPVTGAGLLPPGTYIARISGEEGVSSRRFVVQ